MNKKGFTLTEIIVVIGLLAVIGVVIAVNLTNILGQEEDNNYQEFVKTVENAACSYIELSTNITTKSNCKSSGGCSIKVDDIIKTGLLSKDLENPQDNDLITSMSNGQPKYSVRISWPNNEKKCEMIINK